MHAVVVTEWPGGARRAARTRPRVAGRSWGRGERRDRGCVPVRPQLRMASCDTARVRVREEGCFACEVPPACAYETSGVWRDRVHQCLCVQV